MGREQLGLQRRVHRRIAGVADHKDQDQSEGQQRRSGMGDGAHHREGGQAAQAALQLGVNDGFGTLESALRGFDLLTGYVARLAMGAEFLKAGVDITSPIVTTCGTGVTAAILMLALEEIGASDVALYDGSWTEWGSRPEAPVVRG